MQRLEESLPIRRGVPERAADPCIREPHEAVTVSPNILPSVAARRKEGVNIPCLPPIEALCLGSIEQVC